MQYWLAIDYEPAANLAVTSCSIKPAVYLNLDKYLVCFDTPRSSPVRFSFPLLLGKLIVSDIVPRTVIYIDKIAMADIKNPTSRQVVDQAVEVEEVAVTPGENYIMSFNSSWLREPWFTTHSGYERPAERRWRSSGNKKARLPGREPRHREDSRQSLLDATLAVTQVNNNTKGEFVENVLGYSILLISEDKTRNEDSMPNEAKEQQQAGQRERRKRKAPERCKKGKREGLLTDLHQPPEGHAKALREAGLPSKGLWSLSHRNKAKRISQSEMKPDENKLAMLDLRET